MKVVFDTSIFISAFVIPGGKAEEAYLHALRGDIILCTSVAILTETAKKLREKFDWEEREIIRLLRKISKVAKIIKIQPHLHILADEPDNRVLECATAAKADFVITGDKHLLTLGHFESIGIIKLADFLESLDREG